MIKMFKKKGITSQEHEDCIQMICEQLELTPVKIGGDWTIPNKYFPDAVDFHTDYEIEVVPRTNYIKKKEQKWDRNRKKVLVLKVNSYALSIFDEVYISSDNKKLIKVFQKEVNNGN